MFVKAFAAAALACLLSAPATFAQSTDQPDFYIAVDDTFAKGGLFWNRGSSGVDYRWRVVVKEETIHVCGALKYTGHGQRRLSMSAMRDAYFEFGELKILKNATFFREIRRNQDFANATAQCRSTGVPVPAGRFYVNMAFPKKVYR